MKFLFAFLIFAGVAALTVPTSSAQTGAAHLKDTDGDGLVDDDEVKKYKTDPTNADSDRDKLTDGEEVLKYGTNPNNPDTDADRLKDGYEVKVLGTNPNNNNSDGDDMEDYEDPCPLIFGAKHGCVTPPNKGRALTVSGIPFETGKANLLSESTPILKQADSILRSIPFVRVTINGHTDNHGDPRKNRILSYQRAEAIRKWLIDRGIDGTRLEAKGFGADDPLMPNDTPENCAINRRVEFIIIEEEQASN